MADKRYLKASDIGHLASCETRFALERMRGGGGNRRGSSPDIDAQQRAYEALVAAHHNAQLIDRRCFIASEIYGEAAPETEQLRVYRDTTLTSSLLGRMSIVGYYSVAPAITVLTRRSPLVRRAVRWSLDWIVAKLPQGRGE